LKKNCKNSTVGWIDYVQKFKKEHDFSDKLYGNWIKILGLNQVRKEKEKQRRQHLEDVRNQRERENATTQDEEENVEQEKESLPGNLRGKRLPADSEEQPQPSRVELH
jgi:NAD(P)H-nitrite reductase large subunit